MKRPVFWFIYALLFGFIAMMPALSIYLYYEKPPVSYSIRKVLTPKVPPGGELRIQISADISKSCVSTVYRSIVDSSNIQTDYAPEARPQVTDYVITLTVPLGASPGPAYYSARVEWQCNFVQEWFPQEVIQRNINFEIEPSEGQLPVPERQGVYEKPEQKSELATVP